MAERLKKLLIKYTREDQAGFLPGCFIRENLRTVLNILEFGDKTLGGKLGLFFLDVEKAFDNINWPFMKTVLKTMNFGEKFMNVINNIYS